MERFKRLTEHHVFSKEVRFILKISAIFTAIALPVTAYLIYLHYMPEDSSFCNINDVLNCDIVNKSQWSYLDFGFIQVPVAILGFITYLVLFSGIVVLFKEWAIEKIIPFLKPKMLLFFLTILAAVGTGFSLHLSYIEAFVLHTYCIFCVVQQILIILIFVLLCSAMRKTQKI